MLEFDNNNAKEENYKDDEYWSLPENVRNAIDIGKRNKKHSDFYYKLSDLTQKIQVYKKVFYSKTPKYEKHFLDK